MSRNSLLAFILFAALALTGLWYVYATYYEQIYDFFGVPIEYTVSIEEAFFNVTVADEPHEWRQGLSGTVRLEDQSGMLFVFETEDRYGMWMKDMRYPIDIIWINNELTVVHIEENVSPDTYPEVFASSVPARFVLEVPAFTVETFKLREGNTAFIPTDILPEDLQTI